jgi:uncharacterized membrane protein
MVDRELRADLLHRLFAVGVWLKGVDGVLELAGGLALLTLRNAALSRLAIALTQHELAEDPRDLLANAIRQAAAQVSASTQLFGAIYLLAHGLVKLLVVVGLLRGERWAYPGAIAFLCLFIGYQLYRLSYSFSAGLALLTLFDIAIVALTYREYRLSSD